MTGFYDCCVTRIVRWEALAEGALGVTFESVCLKDNTVRVDPCELPGGAAMAPEAAAAEAWALVKDDAEAWCDAKQPAPVQPVVGRVFDPEQGAFRS